MAGGTIALDLSSHEKIILILNTTTEEYRERTEGVSWALLFIVKNSYKEGRRTPVMSEISMNKGYSVNR